MTAHRNQKKIIRDRQQKTGESYTAARAQVLCARSEKPATPDTKKDHEAVILKVDRTSARVQIRGQTGQLTFRSEDVESVVPGQIATLHVERTWTWRGDAYACGRIRDPRVDVASLGLVPLPLKGGDFADLRGRYEPFRSPDPYTPIWRRLTARPRPYFVMHPITWCAFPDDDVDDDPTCDAMDLADAGDIAGARALLMGLILRDMRCIDAHVHLGNIEFRHAPERAMIHYEIAVRIGELSLPADFDGVLLWSIYNRPFLRGLHGQGLCLWRLGRLQEARRIFERIVSLNPPDNQGIRFDLDDLRHGHAWTAEPDHESTTQAPPHQVLH